jgi:DNA modification methylase
MTQLLTCAANPDAAAVLAMLGQSTYEDVAQATGWSRGRIWALAKRMNARKTEARIRERAAEREARQREELRASLGQTVTADVLDYLDSLPSGCAKLVVTSPPYNIGKAYGGAAADGRPYLGYVGWLIMLISEFDRVLADGGTLFLQLGQTRDETGALKPLDEEIGPWLRRTSLVSQSRVVWTIPHGLTPKRRLAERYETALVFSKGEPTFNATPARIPQKQPGKRAFKGPNKGQLSGHPLGAWPTNVWSDIGNVGHNHPEHSGHPAQFPVALAKRAVLLYTNPGDLVIDPFNGSGSSQVAAIETGRAFSGCDLFFEDIRGPRIAAASMDPATPLPGVTDESVAVWRAEARRIDVPATIDQQIRLF